MAAHFNLCSLVRPGILRMMSWVTHRGRSSSPQADAAGKQKIQNNDFGAKLCFDKSNN